MGEENEMNDDDRVMYLALSCIVIFTVVCIVVLAVGM